MQLSCTRLLSRGSNFTLSDNRLITFSIHTARHSYACVTRYIYGFTSLTLTLWFFRKKRISIGSDIRHEMDDQEDTTWV